MLISGESLISLLPVFPAMSLAANRWAMAPLRLLRSFSGQPLLMSSGQPQSTNGGTVTPDVRAPEGRRVPEVSDEGVRLGVSSEVSVEAQLCGAAYAFSQLESSRGLWQFPCSAQAKLKLRTELFRHLVTALSHSYRECLRRSLGSSSSPASRRLSESVLERHDVWICFRR